jgi:hypothetical protein
MAISPSLLLSFEMRALLLLPRLPLVVSDEYALNARSSDTIAYTVSLSSAYSCAVLSVVGCLPAAAYDAFLVRVSLPDPCSLLLILWALW